MPIDKQKEGKDRKSKFVLLGTMGGGRMAKTRAAPSQVLVIDDQLYLVDCGNGVGRQLVLAGYSLKNLRCVFITHHHNDHNLDYGNILSLAAIEGIKGKVHAYGPYPLQKMTEKFIEWHAYTEGQYPFPIIPVEELVDVHEIADAGPVMEDDNVRVSCTRVVHPPCRNPLAYRFDTEDRAVTISGDTAPTQALVQLAEDSDILIHQVYYKPFAENQDKVRAEYFSTACTTVEEAGKIAREAGVKTLVLSHFIPGDDPEVTEEMWKEGAGKFFKGEVIAGRDLLVI